MSVPATADRMWTNTKTAWMGLCRPRHCVTKRSAANIRQYGYFSAWESGSRRSRFANCPAVFPYTQAFGLRWWPARLLASERFTSSRKIGTWRCLQPAVSTSSSRRWQERGLDSAGFRGHVANRV